jgi:proteasome lid subunit RPN8/RPN11
MNELLDYLEGDKERVGFVLQDGTIVEVPNQAAVPEEGFDVSGEHILKHLYEAKATWHTHPNGTCDLSVGDYHSFLSFPDWSHFIVSPKGVREYVIEDGAVIAR